MVGTERTCQDDLKELREELDRMKKRMEVLENSALSSGNVNVLVP